MDNHKYYKSYSGGSAIQIATPDPDKFVLPENCYLVSRDEWISDQTAARTHVTPEIQENQSNKREVWIQSGMSVFKWSRHQAEQAFLFMVEGLDCS